MTTTNAAAADDARQRYVLPDQPFVEGAGGGIDPDLRHRLISERAYGHYVERNYEDGYEMDDWLQAEAEVDHMLLNPGKRAEAAPSRPV